jgi:hypothetical protein
LSKGVVRSTAQHDLVTALPFSAAEVGDEVVIWNCLQYLSKSDGIRKLPLASSRCAAAATVFGEGKEAVAFCARGEAINSQEFQISWKIQEGTTKIFRVNHGRLFQ